MIRPSLAIAIIAVLAGSVFVLRPADVSGATVKVVLLGGQSNMQGVGDDAGLPTSPVNLTQPQTDVLFYHGDTARSLPANTLTSLAPGSGMDFGPEITLGRTLADASPTDQFALIKYARSATDLTSDWDPATGGTYQTFRNTVDGGIAALEAAGHDVEIVAMVWVQGERDARTGRTASQYTADLNEFIADVRSRYGDDLPFIYSRLSSGQTDLPAASLAAIRAAQDAVASGDPLAHLVDTDGFSLNGDALHFSAAGQIALGEALAGAYLESQNMPTPTAALGGLTLLGCIACRRCAGTHTRERRTR